MGSNGPYWDGKNKNFFVHFNKHFSESTVLHLTLMIRDLSICQLFCQVYSCFLFPHLNLSLRVIEKKNGTFFKYNSLFFD